MHDTFVPLAEYLRGPAPAAAEPVVPDIDEPDVDAPDVDLHSLDENAALEEALADIRRFRAALADALDVRVERLLGDVAAGVLARELRLAPADLRAIVARELALAGEPPVTIHANPNECELLQAFASHVVADSALRSGDVRIELRSGTIVATLGCRLERALAAVVLV
jgi:flagellar biosynthesis/type III secretory pathway protein FliH